MKRLLIGLLILSLAFIITGCEKYGNAGNTYVKFTWTYYQPHTFVTDNPSIPGVFYYGNYYQSNAGTYNLYYETWDGWNNFWWNVSYKLTYKPGQLNNVNGEDSNFSINCSPGGPTIIQTKSSNQETVQVGSIDENGYQLIEVSEDKYVLEKPGITVTYTKMTEKEFNEKIQSL